MHHKKLISFLLFSNVIFCSGGFDIGTATGKGKFQFDFTLNPFDKIDFGQTYGVLSYGITDRADFHAYFSRHKGPFYTWYAGIFYQFYKSEILDLATAVGIRRRVNEKWNNYFVPQLLYTIHLNDKFYLGGSFVQVNGDEKLNRLGVAIDTGIFYKINYETKFIDSISIGITGFRPAIWKPDSYFLPTYSIDFKFK